MSASSLPPTVGEKDQQFVTPTGRSVEPTIDGVVLRPALSQADQRGEVVELLSDGWPDVFGEGVPHVYLATIVPGVIKGWVCHNDQDDRSVQVFGRLRWVLYDGREDSPTFGLVQTVTCTESSRHLVVVPAGVWHAVENVGPVEAGFVNMPTRPYNHAVPDKFRLPLNTPEIPFTFPGR